jgi:hypothetical protein
MVHFATLVKKAAVDAVVDVGEDCKRTAVPFWLAIPTFTLGLQPCSPSR